MYATAFKSGTEIFQVPPTLWPSDPQWNIGRVFETTNIGRYVVNSLIVAGGATALVVSLGTGCAYVLSRAGESVAGRPSRRRDVAMVFQFDTLYPHTSVERNMNYSLRLRRSPRETIEAATRSAAETPGLGALLHRFPRDLSGGQRLRVAMGRAIVRSPKVFLLLRRAPVQSRSRPSRPHAPGNPQAARAPRRSPSAVRTSFPTEAERGSR